MAHFCLPAGSLLIITVVFRPKPERLLVNGALFVVVAQAPGRANFVAIDGVDGLFVVARGEAEFFELLGAVDVHTSLAWVPGGADWAGEVGSGALKLTLQSKLLLGDNITITLAVWLVVDRHLKVRACIRLRLGLRLRLNRADDHRRDRVPRF